jgi:hypothetical protein
MTAKVDVILFVDHPPPKRPMYFPFPLFGNAHGRAELRGRNSYDQVDRVGPIQPSPAPGKLFEPAEPFGLGVQPKSFCEYMIPSACAKSGS